MKRTYYSLLMATLPLYITTTGCESSPHKQNVMQAQAIHVVHDDKSRNASDSDAQKASIVKEWEALKASSEIKFRNYELLIAELDQPMKVIVALERRNRDLKARMEAYQPSLSDWEVFKRAFNNDVEELRLSLKQIAVIKK